MLKAVVMLGVLAGSYFGTVWLMDRPIDTVMVKGKFERVSAVKIEAALAPYLAAGFLSVDLNFLREQLTELPWVAGASVRRKGPAFLEVTVLEEQAAACWGKDGLLNTNGDLFVEHTSHVPVELPRLNGPPDTQHVVASRYFDLQARLEQRGLSAVSLTMNDRGAWEMALSNGIRVRFGTESVDERIAQFFRALDRVIAARDQQIDYVDMRYTNGFAIGWKDSGAMPASAAQGNRPNAY